MIELFEEYVKWKILAHFLRNPTSWFHIREIARILDVSPASASSALKMLEGGGVLLKEKKGLAHLYVLNPDSPIVPPLKKAYGIALVLDTNPRGKFIAADEDIISIALFGSYADGSFDEKSDVDFLVITPSEEKRLVKVAKSIEREIGRNVSLSVFKLHQWRRLARSKDAFYGQVVENHILIHGSGIK